MKLSIAMIFIALLLSGCNKQSAAEREAHDRAKPGYAVAKSYCTQCHSLPYGDQHPPTAWPYVIARMEGNMQAAHKRMPNPSEREAIIAFFQSN